MAQVNVATMVNDVPFQISYIFTDDADGDKQAQETFKHMIKESGGQDKDMDACVKCGSYEDDFHRFNLVR